MGQNVLLAIVFALGVGGIAGFIFLSSERSAEALPPGAYSVPNMPGMTVPVAYELSDELIPALLIVIYEAFAQTQEDTIYDQLAKVTHGDALEYLYLERVGAMEGNGLDQADQTIHEISLLDSLVTQSDETLEVDATWQVIGTVGHAEHLHVRGNTYYAALSISPIEGAWRITDFDLLEVSRDSAGEVFQVLEENQ